MIVRLPLFPLPNTVLFPRTHLPLHVFEPRYRDMMEIAMAGDRRIGICHLRPGFEGDYFGAPPVYRMMTIARILIADKMDDGRWNMLVEGVQRATLIEELQREPFRLASVQTVEEGIPETQRDEAMRLARSLSATAESIARTLGEKERNLTNLLNTHMHPAVVCDIVAAVLVSDAYSRQSILEETDVLRRLRLVSVQVHDVVTHLQDNGVTLDHPGGD